MLARTTVVDDGGVYFCKTIGVTTDWVLLLPVVCIYCFTQNHRNFLITEVTMRGTELPSLPSFAHLNGHKRHFVPRDSNVQTMIENGYPVDRNMPQCIENLSQRHNLPGHGSPGRIKFDMAIRSARWQRKTDLDIWTQANSYLE